MSVSGSGNHSNGSNERLSRLGVELSELPSMISNVFEVDPTCEKRLKLGRYLILGELGRRNGGRL